MKNFTIIISLFATMNIFAQTTSIPDNNFEQALIDLGYDTGTPDGTVPTANISVLTSLDVFQKNISDLTGIEDFISLTNLNCSLNQLTSLDVTQNISLTNLSCFGNQISGIDITQNTSLTELMCNSNQLTSLNLTQNTSLDKLFCQMNQLTSLDVSLNTSLIELVCFNNQLTSLNVKNGNNANITNFYADNNPNLTCIFVDDKDATYLNDWTKDATSTFVETEAECDALTTVKDIKNSNFIIYPNPTKETFSIKTDNKINEVKIYDVFGKLVEVFDSNENYNVSSFAKGIYLVYVNSEDGVMVSKLIVE